MLTCLFSFMFLSGVVHLSLSTLSSWHGYGSVWRISFFDIDWLLLLVSWTNGNWTFWVYPRILEELFLILSTDFWTLSALDLLLLLASFIDFYTKVPKFYFTLTTLDIFSLSGEACFFGDFLFDFTGLPELKFMCNTSTLSGVVSSLMILNCFYY
jgi:hypothetical protein